MADGLVQPQQTLPPRECLVWLQALSGDGAPAHHEHKRDRRVQHEQRRWIKGGGECRTVTESIDDCRQRSCDICLPAEQLKDENRTAGDREGPFFP